MNQQQPPQPELELTIRLPLSRIVAGAELPVILTMTNRGGAAVEAPSLHDNNEVTNYEITFVDGRTVATVNDVSRQRLLRMDQRLTRGELRMRSFAPGEAEVLKLQDLLLLYWLDRPGRYRIRGLYCWKDHLLRSETATLTVEPALVTAHDHQWCFHYGEEYWLHTAWVHQDGGAHNIMLRESCLFDPHAINFSRQVFGQEEPCEPVVSLNTTLLANSHVWLAWLSGARVSYLRTDRGETATLPESLEVDLQRPRLLGPPWMLHDLSLLLLLEGAAGQGQGGVQAIHVDRDGQEIKRALLTDLPAGAGQLQGLVDLDGGLHLLWTVQIGQRTEVHLAPLDPTTLALGGKPRRVFATDRPVLRLVAPPVLPRHEALACLLQDDPRQPHQLALQRFHHLGEGDPPPPEPLTLPADRPIQCMEATLDADATLHLLLLTDDGEVLYYNDHRQQVSSVTRLEPRDLPTPLSLVVSPDGDVHAVYRRAGQGLREKLVRTSRGDEDGDF